MNECHNHRNIFLCSNVLCWCNAGPKYTLSSLCLNCCVRCSFGIVLWEIATGKIPFKGVSTPLIEMLCVTNTISNNSDTVYLKMVWLGFLSRCKHAVVALSYLEIYHSMSVLLFFWSDCSHKDVYQRVYKEKYTEPLPKDCPKQLGELINDCRSYDSFQRPTAGGNTFNTHN